MSQKYSIQQEEKVKKQLKKIKKKHKNNWMTDVILNILLYQSDIKLVLIYLYLINLE